MVFKATLKWTPASTQTNAGWSAQFKLQSRQHGSNVGKTSETASHANEEAEYRSRICVFSSYKCRQSSAGAKRQETDEGVGSNISPLKTAKCCPLYLPHDRGRLSKKSKVHKEMIYGVWCGRTWLALTPLNTFRSKTPSPNISAWLHCCLCVRMGANPFIHFPTSSGKSSQNRNGKKCPWFCNWMLNKNICSRCATVQILLDISTLFCKKN